MIRRTAFHGILALSLSLFWCGCGSAPNSQENLAIFNSVSNRNVLTGRVLTEGNGSGFVISGFNQAGELLFKTPASLSTGSFLYPPNAELRRLVAYRHLTGQAPEYYATDRVFSTREVYLSPVTTLATVYRDRHPGATSTQAESAVRKVLGLAPGFQPGLSEQTRRFGISLKRYRDYMAAAPAPADAPASFASANHPAHVRLLEPIGPPIYLSDGAPDLNNLVVNLAQTELTLGIQAAAGDPEGAAVTLVSWGMGLLGLALPSSDPTAQALSQIQSQLTSIQNQINSLSQQVTDEVNQLAALVQQQAALSQYVSLEAALLPQLNTADAAQVQFNTTPQGAGAQVASLVAAVSTPSFVSIPSTIADSYGGSSDPNVPSMQALLSAMTTQRVAAPVFRANSLQDSLFDQAQLYMGRQYQATVLATNGLHALTPPNVTGAVTLFNQLCDRLSYQQSRIPLALPSDNIFLIRSNGLICMKSFFGLTDYVTASAVVADWNEGGLTGWHLADAILLLNNSTPLWDGGQFAGPPLPTQAQVQAWLTDLGLDSFTLNQPFITYNGPFFPNDWNYYQLSLADYSDPNFFNWANQEVLGYAWFYTHASQMANNPSLFATVSDGPSGLRTTQTGLQMQATGNFTCPNSADDLTTYPSVTLAVDMTGNVTWSSSNTNVVTVSNIPGSNGLLQPQNQGGTATISCSRVNQLGQVVTASQSVTVSAPPAPVVTQIQMSPRSATITAGNIQQLFCTGLLSNSTGTDLTSQAQWSTDNPALGSIQVLPNGTAYLVVPSTATFGSLNVTCQVDSKFQDSTTFFVIP